MGIPRLLHAVCCCATCPPGQRLAFYRFIVLYGNLVVYRIIETIIETPIFFDSIIIFFHRTIYRNHYDTQHCLKYLGIKFSYTVPGHQLVARRCCAERNTLRKACCAQAPRAGPSMVVALHDHITSSLGVFAICVSV